MRRRMQMIFQDPYASPRPADDRRRDRRRAAGHPRRRRRRRSGASGSASCSRLVGLNPDYGDRYPHEFCGGQRQRIGVARALALDPDLIVADEPISALDVSIQAQVINLLERLQGRLGLTYLFIAHDLSVVRHISDRIAVMYLGRIVELGPVAGAQRAGRSTRTRSRCCPRSRSRTPRSSAVRRRIILRGDVPSPVNPPSGCHFHTRCWLRERLGQPGALLRRGPGAPRRCPPATRSPCHFAEEVEGSKEQLQATGRGGAASAAPAGGEAAAAAVPVSRRGVAATRARRARAAGAVRGGRRRRGRAAPPAASGA